MCDDTCRQCGEMLPEHEESRPGRCRVFCSRACGAKYRHQPKAKLQGACVVCGDSFETHVSTRRYCSIRCGEIARGVRLAEPLPTRICALPGCGEAFQPKRRMQRCCCEAHGKEFWKVRALEEGRLKRDPWSDRRRDDYHRRRALKKQASTGRPVRLAEVAERDRWKCHICGKRVAKSRAWPHPRSASLDHVVPLSRGGAHDPANVRLAHLECNTAKNNRGGNEQLLLIG